MKKFLMIAALAAMIAAPAMADSIGKGTRVDVLPLHPSQEGHRDVPYSLNPGVNEVYDNLAAQLGGVGNPVQWAGAGIPSSWVFEDVHADTSLSTTATHWHAGIQHSPSGSTVTRTQIAGYFQNPGGADTSNAGPLLTTSGSPAVFIYSLPGLTPGYAQFINGTHPAVQLPAGGDMYFGFLSFDNLGYWGNSLPSVANGSSHLANMWFGLPSFVTSAYGPATGLLPTTSAAGFTTGQLIVSIGFTPEPATIGVLALGGLLALRRRRA